mmetsp:Transcript_28118/g.47789  ORF Transcript_28118/g.47789 Transcript_28118/m.47789 type:complete len:215 (-) Transcript_28118:1205-1849(-)
MHPIFTLQAWMVTRNTVKHGGHSPLKNSSCETQEGPHCEISIPYLGPVTSCALYLFLASVLNTDIPSVDGANTLRIPCESLNEMIHHCTNCKLGIHLRLMKYPEPRTEGVCARRKQYPRIATLWFRSQANSELTRSISCCSSALYCGVPFICSTMISLSGSTSLGTTLLSMYCKGFVYSSSSPSNCGYNVQMYRPSVWSPKSSSSQKSSRACGL